MVTGVPATTLHLTLHRNFVQTGSWVDRRGNEDTLAGQMINLHQLYRLGISEA
jgi:hypothetical protein